MYDVARKSAALFHASGAVAIETAIPFAAVVLLVFSVLLAGTPASAQHGLVSRASGEWSSRLIRAIAAMERGDHGRGIETLQAALLEGDRVVLRVPSDFDGTLDELRVKLTRLQAIAAAAPKRPVGPLERENSREGGLFRRFSRAPSRPPTSWSRYVRVSTVAGWVLARLPKDVISAYRARYESAAVHLRAGFAGEDGRIDEAPLDRVARLYPLTLTGLDAAESLAELELERGAYLRAALRFSDLLESNGLSIDESDDAVTRIRKKCLLAWRLAGDIDRYTAVRESVLANIEPAARREAFARELEGLEGAVPMEEGTSGELPEGVVTALPSRWGGELPGGNPATSPAVPELPEGPFGTSWQSLSWLRSVVVSAFQSDPRERFGSPFGRAIVFHTIDFPFVPLVDGGRLFISGVFHLFQIDARPGTGKILTQPHKPHPVYLASRFKESSDSPIYSAALWRKSDDHSAVRGGAGEYGAGAFEGVPDSVVVTHYLSSSVRRDDYMGYAITAKVATRSLAAFDGATLEPLWKTLDLRPVVPRDPFGPNEIPVHVSYSSPPLVRGERVFAAGWQQKGYINSVVRSLDLRTGKTVWETPIGSSQMEQTMFGELAREPFASFLVEEDGVLYYQSNLGAVAALDAASGEVLWTTTYDFIPPAPTMGRSPILRDLVWGLGPPLLLGNVLVVTPRDSTLLLGIDTGRGPDGMRRGGEVLWYFDNSHGLLRDFLGYFAGPAGDAGALYFTGSGGVEALDLSMMNARGRVRDLPRKEPRTARVDSDVDAPTDAFLRQLQHAVDDSRNAPTGDAQDRATPGRELLARLPRLRRIPARYGGTEGSVEAPGLLTRKGVLYTDDTGLFLVNPRLNRRDRLVAAPNSARGRGFVSGRVTLAGDLILVTSQLWITAYGSPVY